MIEGVDFTVSYTPVVIIKPVFIIIKFASEERFINFILDISSAFKNTILPNTKEIVYLSLPSLYLE